MAATPDKPRVAPIPPKEWPPRMRDAFTALQVENPRHPYPIQDPGRPKGLNVLGMFANHPDLAVAYHHFNGHILFGTSLSLRQRELLVLRVAALRGSEYEWKQHVVQGFDAGLTDEEIESIAQGPGAGDWSLLERAMLTAVDELVADALITDETYAVLAAELDVHQLMDLVFTVGAYEVLAMAMRTFGVQVDEDLANWKRPSL